MVSCDRRCVLSILMIVYAVDSVVVSAVAWCQFRRGLSDVIIGTSFASRVV